MKVQQLLEGKSTAAGVDELNKFVQPIINTKLKAGVETPISAEQVKAITKAMKQAGYDVESHSATRGGKKVGMTATIGAKASSDTSLTVRTYKDQSHVFIIVTS